MKEYKCPRCEDQIVEPNIPCPSCGLTHAREELEDFADLEQLLKKVLGKSHKEIDFDGMWENIVKAMGW